MFLVVPSILSLLKCVWGKFEDGISVAHSYRNIHLPPFLLSNRATPGGEEGGEREGIKNNNNNKKDISQVWVNLLIIVQDPRCTLFWEILMLSMRNWGKMHELVLIVCFPQEKKKKSFQLHHAEAHTSGSQCAQSVVWAELPLTGLGAGCSREWGRRQLKWHRILWHFFNKNPLSIL